MSNVSNTLKTVEFEVLIRPATGRMALGEEMGKRAGVTLTEFAS